MIVDYDVIVVGAGPGGYVCALRLAQLGKKTALVEQAELGGTCLNAGCVPTKTLLRESSISRDTMRAYERKDAVVSNQREGIAQLMKAASVDVYNARGQVAPGPVVVLNEGAETLRATAVVVASGAVPAVPPIPGADLAQVVTSDDVLLTDEVQPQRLVIIGGGVIGVEMASLYANLGSQVTIIEALPRLLANMDREIGQSLAMQYKKEGIVCHTGAAVQRITALDEGLEVCFEAKGKEAVVEADAVLFATGRRAATADLFAAGFEPEMVRGRIVTDGQFATSLPGVYAIGDVTGGIQLAHHASAQGKCLAAHLAGSEEALDLSLIPACVYTVPEIATVGMDQAQAKEAGIETIVGKFTMAGNAKTIIDELPRSFIKLIFRADDHRLIGGVLYCGRASDLVSAVTLAIRGGMTAEDLADTVFAHPTYGEGIGEAAEVALGKCVHVVSR